MLTIRNLTHAEAIDPHSLPEGLRIKEFPYLDEDWCWITESPTYGAVSLIVTSFVHGYLFFWRILTTPARRKVTNHLLFSLPKVLENARERGCVGYASFLHDTPIEAKLAGLIQSHGGVIVPWSGSLAMNTLYPELINARSGNFRATDHSLAGSGSR